MDLLPGVGRLQLPDISADADPYTGYIIYLTENVTDPQTNTTSPQLTATPWGGTSAAAPLWAAMTALVNASPACNGHNLGALNPLLYQVAVKGMPGLTNIIAGNNDNAADNPTGYFAAGRGFSPVTGLGTPVAAALARSLCAQADTLTLNAPASESSSYGQAVDVTGIAGSDAEGHPLTYGATGLPAGLAIDPTSGAVTGTPTANANASVRVTVTAADNGATQTRIIAWTVTGAPATATTVTSTVPTPAPPSTTTTTTGDGQGGAGGVSKSTPVRLIHLTRRVRGHTIRVTLTVTSRGDRRQLRVAYNVARGRSKLRVKAVELLLRPTAYIATRGARRPRPVVLQRTNASTGELTVALNAARATRGLSVALQYASGPQVVIALPHL